VGHAIKVGPRRRAGVQLRCVNSIDQVSARDWDRLAGTDSPFLRHAFLAALERHDCVGAGSGWYPHHLLLEDAGTLRGAVPLYLKTNSYGEFVFDWSWAHAYERNGLAYYPKLVSAIPYTPAPGARLLVADCQLTDADVRNTLARGLLALAQELAVSTLHCLFLQPKDQQALAECDLASRVGCQFHWHNHGYQHFDHFLGELNSKKRKNIRRERRLVAEAGLQLDTVPGAALSREDWVRVHALYRNTFERLGGVASFTLGFFQETARTLPEALIVTTARRHGDIIAAAILWRGDRVLYGRHWGCFEHHDALHFEACYYRGIEYCIANGLETFEPGAQGEHKVARGFLPVLTQSCHWVAHEGFRESIVDFVTRESPAVQAYAEEMREHSPYRGDRA
jgi:predicted N-acyltransferase